MMHFRVVAGMGAAVAVMLCCGACTKATGEKQPPNPAKMAVPVRVAAVAKQEMPEEFSTIGTVEAYSTISVRAQVGGELIKVCFTEGDVVDKDQVLFNIDPKPYEVALRQAEANFAKSQAQLEQTRAAVAKDKVQADNAQVEMKRSASLLPKRMISQEEYDRAKANAEALEAAVLADEANVKASAEAIRVAEVAIEDAKLRLDYCTIRSPIRGKTGSLMLNQGNLVKANDTTPMVVITQTSPIYVTFSLPERNLAEVRRRMAAGPLETRATARGEGGEPALGTLSFIDNTVNQGNGTIRLKSTFDNADGRLWPGQYVDVVLKVAVQADAVVVPEQAILPSQAGFSVYVVKPDLTAELRNVVPGDSMNDVTIITDGLAPEEKVVIDGQSRLAPGVTVKILGEGGAEGEKK